MAKIKRNSKTYKDKYLDLLHHFEKSLLALNRKGHKFPFKFNFRNKNIIELVKNKNNPKEFIFIGYNNEKIVINLSEICLQEQIEILDESRKNNLKKN